MFSIRKYTQRGKPPEINLRCVHKTCFMDAHMRIWNGFRPVKCMLFQSISKMRRTGFVKTKPVPCRQFCIQKTCTSDKNDDWCVRDSKLNTQFIKPERVLERACGMPASNSGAPKRSLILIANVWLYNMHIIFHNASMKTQSVHWHVHCQNEVFNFWEQALR